MGLQTARVESRTLTWHGQKKGVLWSKQVRISACSININITQLVYTCVWCISICSENLSVLNRLHSRNLRRQTRTMLCQECCLEFKQMLEPYGNGNNRIERNSTLRLVIWAQNAEPFEARGIFTGMKTQKEVTGYCKKSWGSGWEPIIAWAFCPAAQIVLRKFMAHSHTKAHALSSRLSPASRVIQRSNWSGWYDTGSETLHEISMKNLAG